MYELSNKKIVTELENLLSGKSMKPLSGVPKKCYKYALTAVFINICGGRHFTQGQEGNYQLVYNIKKEPKEFNEPLILKGIKHDVETSLKNSFYYNYNDYQTIDKIIPFFRGVVKEMKKNGNCLMKISEMEELFDVKRTFEKNHKNIQPHHWIDVNLFNGMVLTVPEFFTYSDIVNNWNTLVDKLNDYDESISNYNVPLIERVNKIENRKRKYEIDTLMRTLWISSVTFAESYLYYLFYNIKESNYQIKSESGERILQLHKIEDMEIINLLIIPEFFLDAKYHELKVITKKYKELNDKRNRFIHPSAFSNESNTSELLPLLTVTIEQVIDTLETCIQLVKIVDDNLPDDLKILIWWDRVKHPNFKDIKKGDITNPNSKLSYVGYFNN